MPDFSVPRWLEPPNEAERARIDEATRAAQEKAGTMIRRQIGMRRMQEEAAQAQQNGVDPVTARQNALLNNAHLLFSDNPQAVGNILNHEEANQVRERANLQLNQHREMQDILRAQVIKNSQEALDQKSKHNAEVEALNREKLTSLDEARHARAQAEIDKLDAARDRNEMLEKLRKSEEEGRNLRSDAQQKRLTEQAATNAKIKVESMLQTDPGYLSIVGDLTKARAESAKAHRSTGKTLGIFGYSKEDVQKADTELAKAQKAVNDYRNKVGKRFGVDMSMDEGDEETPAPSPVAPPPSSTNATKRLKWTPQGLVPVQ